MGGSLGGNRLARGLELCSVWRCCHAVQMEESMCWEIDFKFLAEHKKAQETRIKQEQRVGVIDQLLNEANKQGEKTNVEERRSRRSRLRNSPPATAAEA